MNRSNAERESLADALNNVRAETVARGMNSPTAFAGNRAQRRKAKRAYDRAVKRRK